MRRPVRIMPGVRFPTVAGTVLAAAMTIQALLAITPALAQQSLPDCVSAGNTGECRTEWNENRPATGVGHLNARDGKSTYIATGNIGSAKSPADIINITSIGKRVSGGYVINHIRNGEVVLNNSARIYLKSTTDSPNGALILGRTAEIGTGTYVTNERAGFLNADNGIWTGWDRSRRAIDSQQHYDHLISATNEGTIQAKQVGVTVHHHDFFGDIQITERGMITAGETGIQANGGDEATVTVADGAQVTSVGDGVKRTARAGGTVTVEDGATITAATADGSDKWGVDFTVDAEPNNPDRELTAAQKSATVDVSGVIDSGHGGIRVQNNGPGTTMVTVTESGSVTGTQFGILATGSGAGAVTVDVAGTVSGAGMDAIKVEATGDTTVTLKNDFRVEGGIRLNGADDNDDLTLEVAEGMRGEVMGEINGVSMLVKDGMGTARLAGDVSLAGGSTVSIRDGVLVLRGHVDLGTGTFMVADGKRMMIEVGPGNEDHGRITAGTITLPDGTPVYVSLDDDARQEAAVQLSGEITPFLGGAKLAGVPVVFHRYNSVKGVMVGSNGTITADLTSLSPDPLPGQGGSGSGGGNSAALLVVGGGALAYLLWDLGLFDNEALSGIRSNARGLEYRMRSLDRSAMPAANMVLPASGIATSLRAHLGNGIHADFTGTPNLSLADRRHAQSGRRYGLGLGWQTGAFSTDIGVSRATLDTRSTFSNLAGLGMLSGTHGQRHDQLRANAELRIEKAGLSLAPSLSLYGGTVSDKGYMASSPVWLSEVPPVTRDYSGWKAGMTVAPRSSLETMGLRWRPELRVTTARLADGGGEDLEIVQRDRAGAIRLQTPARATLPQAVHALGGKLTVTGGENWSLQGGYVAMLADGDLEHAAVTGFRLRF